MDLQLRDKNVLVTGGSKGVGLACARLFMSEGARVALVSRSQANLDAARDALGAVHTFAADLVDAEAAAAMVERVEAEFGAIDVLVNSAGAARRTDVDALTPAVWRAAMDAKYFTYINVIDPVVKRMASRGDGVVVNVIGVGGKIASSVHLAGGSANAALMLATTGLARAYASRGVRVVGVNPGPIDTERAVEGLRVAATRAGISEAEARTKASSELGFGRFASADEIADIVVFAASARGRYLSGANLTTDGASSGGGGLIRGDGIVRRRCDDGSTNVMSTRRCRATRSACVIPSPTIAPMRRRPGRLRHTDRPRRRSTSSRRVPAGRSATTRQDPGLTA